MADASTEITDEIVFALLDADRRREMTGMRRRFWALGLLIAVLAAGLVVHAVLPEAAATDIAGDALYAAAVYLAVVVVAPRARPVVVGAIAVAWGVAIELFQLTGLPLQIAAVVRPAVLVLGTAFDPRDLAIAVVVPAVLAASDVVVGRCVRRTPRVDG